KIPQSGILTSPIGGVMAETQFIRNKHACDQRVNFWSESKRRRHMHGGSWQSKLTLLARRLENFLQPNPRKAQDLIADELAKKLWGGFSAYAIRDLDRLTSCAVSSAEERSTAAWHLARWYHVQQDYARALDCVILMRHIYPQARPSKKWSLLEVDCLLRLARIQEAREILELKLRDSDFDPDLYLAYANAYVYAHASLIRCEGDAHRLE